MLSPKRTKYRKYHRGRMRGKKTRGNEICFGNFGLQALEPTWITSRQIEAARRTITDIQNVVLPYGFEFFQIKQ
jgi:large subunit ribosomal protein L16